MQKPLLSRLAIAITLAMANVCASAGQAGVIVLANRTDAKINMTTLPAGGRQTARTIEPRDVVPITVADKLGVTFETAGGAREYLLTPNSIHYFLVREGKLDLVRIALPGFPENLGPTPLASAAATDDAVCTIPVMLLADDDEPAQRAVWEPRFRRRLSEASAIIERHCRVRFEVVAVGTWVTANGITKFEESLREFEQKVIPAPARVAIGFTSQYKIYNEKTDVGGTRQPFHTHILIREWAPNISHIDRVEILLHELGHFLGAAHSAEPTSAMRPMLGDHRNHALGAHLGYDPPNTLAMWLLGEELRTRQIHALQEVRPEVKAQLRSIYTAMLQASPKDPAATKYIELLGMPGVTIVPPERFSKTLIRATQKIVTALTEAAEENHRLPPGTGEGGRREGDRLTEFYVRRAAATALGVPDDVAADALLLGLGIVLDDSSIVRSAPVVGQLWQRIEPDEQRRRRLSTLGSPTMLGRHDWAQHFFVSGALVPVVGAGAAENAGILKELKDAQGGSGFSFADLSADMAGVMFATRLRDNALRLKSLQTFAVADYLPEAKDLKEGIPWAEFFAAYGSTQDDRFYRQQTLIRQRIGAMPGFEKAKRP